MNKLIFVFAVLFIGFSNLAIAVKVDEDSCWNAPRSCVQTSSKWKKSPVKEFGNKLIVKLKNICSGGVYVTSCFERKEGRESCGSFYIRPGKSYNIPYAGHSEGEIAITGRHDFRVVGVQKSSNNWVCASKVPNWHDDFFTK